MNYKMKVHITDPTAKNGLVSDLYFELDCNFVYDAKQYGNGHYLSIKGKNFYCQSFDLRYDKSFNRNHKEKWLERWAHNYWCGTNGAWAIKSLEITKE